MDGVTLTHEACLPWETDGTASQTLYQNRLSRFYGDYGGRTPLPTASRVTGFASLSLDTPQMGLVAVYRL